MSEDNEHTKNDKNKIDMFHYRNMLNYMGANVPIQVLCLPKVIEKALINADCLRVYDLINRDLREIKGIGEGRCDLLASRLEEFLTVSL